jgi:hypothetical protein
MNNANNTDKCTFVLVVLVLFILEHLCLARYIKCTFISGVSVVHSGGHVFTALF